MAVVKEYLCPGHGPFEATRPRCPHGCTVVSEREFRTAPAFHDGTTRRTDDLVRSQVEAFRLSNIKTNLREGDTAKFSDPKVAAHQQAIAKMFPSPWGQVPKGGKLKVGTGEIEGSGPGAAAVYPSMKKQSAAEVEQVLGSPMNSDVAEPMRGKKFSYEAVKDKEGLKMDVSKAA